MSFSNKKIEVIGLGYVGLPLACIIANQGFNVLGYDINENLVKSINDHTFQSEEPGLKTLLNEVQCKQFFAFTEPQKADIYIICVPTPLTECKKPDLSYVESAAKTIAKFIKPGDLIILESTIPIGTTESIKNSIFSINKNITNHDIYFSHCPERVLPGNALEEIIYNKRIIGGLTNSATDITAEFYSNFCEGEIIKTTDKTAELVKLSENTFRDINIAYANELSMICEENNIDVKEVIKYANMHPRVNIHNPGVGVGGHCIPVDPWFIVNQTKEYSNLIKKAREVNIMKEKWIANKIFKTFKAGKFNRIVLAGITYKKDVDDFRESPSLRIAELIHSELKQKIILFDPYISKLKVDNKKFLTCQKINLSDNDLVAIMVDHKEFSFLSALYKNNNSNQESFVMNFS